MHRQPPCGSPNSFAIAPLCSKIEFSRPLDVNFRGKEYSEIAFQPLQPGNLELFPRVDRELGALVARYDATLTGPKPERVYPSEARTTALLPPRAVVRPIPSYGGVRPTAPLR